jgi:hypothetical protein
MRRRAAGAFQWATGIDDDGMITRALLREVRGTGISLLARRQRRPIVMVLGMRCSGTYLCSHVLSALGLDMTDNMRLLVTTDRATTTRSGHWERWGNHRVPRPHLAVLQPRVFQPLQRLRVTGRVVGGSARTARDHRFLEGQMGNGYFGFKDPGTFRLMPMCHQIINELKLAPESSSAQSAAAAKSMEVQLAMAQSAMAAARQFGSPAINALAIDERTPIAYPRLGGLEG